MTNILKYVQFKCAVSSVLNKDPKQYGKQFMFDDEEDTSWSSNQGVPQHIAIQFEEPQEISSFHIQFQGGFAGKNGCIQLENDNGETSKEDFYPEDINALQTFKLKEKYQSIKKMKIIFNESTDFFGRIIVYKLEMF